MNVQDLLGSNPLSKKLANYIASLTTEANINQPTSPEVKSYSDAVYFNYYHLGLSLQFAPVHGEKLKSGLKQHELNHENLSLDNVYLYNTRPTKQKSTKPQGSSRSAELAFSSYPISPFTLNLNPDIKDKDGNSSERPPTIEVHPDMSGKEFVKVLLEPDRKGGGTGPSSGSIGIWCEWLKDGMMVEFGGDEARGPHAWEQGKDAIWKIITLFAPS